MEKYLDKFIYIIKKSTQPNNLKEAIENTIEGEKKLIKYLKTFNIYSELYSNTALL